MSSRSWDATHDLLIVGSGASGLAAAITAAHRGLKPLVIEKSALWGGTTALSGGGMWLPGNRLQASAGREEPLADVLEFIGGVVEDEGAVTAEPKRMAFFRAAPVLVDLLQAQGMRWLVSRQPDYLSHPKAKPGRSLDAAVIDGARLGPWLQNMRRSGAPLGLEIIDIPRVSRGWTSVESTLAMGRVWADNKLRNFIGQVPMGCGESLAAQLMMIALKLGVEIRLQTSVLELITMDDRVVGARVGGPEGERSLRAERGVILCAGGFARASEMRMALQGLDGETSSTSPEDTGDVFPLTAPLGAKTAMMDEAWWGTAFQLPGVADPVFCMGERSFPYGMMVDGRGLRFVNESADYFTIGKEMRKRGMSSAWLILDARHRRRYMFCGMLPGRTPPGLFEAGFFKRAFTIAGLAEACGLDPENLQRTAARFSAFAKAGKDNDFKRGEGAYDRFWSDPAHGPNPNLGPIEEGPFLAARVMVNDLGTKGGLLTDEHSRVLHDSGAAIPGLYAAGNSTASVFGRGYPGPGATLGPAMVFGHVAANHAADANG